MNHIYRDDDVSVHTDAYLFKELHKQFLAKGQIHTVAVVMKDLWENQAIFWYLATAPMLEIGLHGWEHQDYSLLPYKACYRALQRALEYWRENTQRMVGETKPIKIFFAPWNKEGPGIKKACADLGLEFCNVKSGEWQGNEIHSFHWWSVMMGELKVI